MKKISSSLIFSIWNGIFIGVVAIFSAVKIALNTGMFSPEQFLENLYFFSFEFSYFFLIASSITFVFSLLFYKRCNKVLFSLIALINFLFVAYLVADSYVFVLYRTHLNIAMLQMTFLGGGKIVSFSFEVWLKIIGLLIICLVVGGLISAIAHKLVPCFRSAIFCLVFLLLVFVGDNFVYAYCVATFKTDYTSLVEKIPLLKPLTMSRFLAKHGIISKEDVERQSLTAKPSGKDMKYPLKELACPGGSKKNIVFLFVDTLRSDMFSKDITPNLWNFAEKNTYFSNAYSNGNNTRHGIFSLFTGLPGSYWEKSLVSSTPSVLITELQKQKYDIGIFTGAPLNLPEFHTTIFSTVKNLRVWPRGEGAIQSDNFAIDDFETWINSLPKDQSFFSFIFLDTVHAYDFPKTPENEVFKPYLKKIDHLALNNDYDETEYLNTYKNSVHYADTLVKRVLDFLEQKGLMDDTIVVIGSDHGDEFNDNKLNYWSHGGNFTDPQIKIPLIIHWPGKESGIKDYQVSLLDLVPSLLPEVLGCSNPISDYSVGQNIWEQERKRNWFYSSGYDRSAFVEPDGIVLLNKARLLEFFDKTYRPSKDKSIPPYMM